LAATKLIDVACGVASGESARAAGIEGEREDRAAALGVGSDAPPSSEAAGD
jgi:hypothetical protein